MSDWFKMKQSLNIFHLTSILHLWWHFKEKYCLKDEDFFSYICNYLFYFKLMLRANYLSQAYEIWTQKMSNIVL